MADAAEYDPRYLEGIALFNAGEYFDAHEVWEALWRDTAGGDRRFYQGLIQAAVAVYHAHNGNALGAQRLFDSGRRHMSPYGPAHLGLDVAAIWQAVAMALAEPLAADRLPVITLSTPSAPG